MPNENERSGWKIKFILNLKFVFHCFFYLRKMNEDDPEYTQLIE